MEKYNLLDELTELMREFKTLPKDLSMLDMLDELTDLLADPIQQAREMIRYARQGLESSRETDC